MKKILLLLSFPFLSCASFQTSFMDLTLDSLGGRFQGSIKAVEKGSNFYLISGQENSNMRITFSPKGPENLLDKLKLAEQYDFQSIQRPDGPIEFLTLSDKIGILAIFADGVPPGNIPGLNISVKDNHDDGILLISEGKETLVTIGRSVNSLIDNTDFKVYLLNKIVGDSQFDQPPLRIDLILVRQ